MALLERMSHFLRQLKLLLLAEYNLIRLKLFNNIWIFVQGFYLEKKLAEIIIDLQKQL